MMPRLTRWGCDVRGQGLVPVPLVRRALRNVDARRALRKATVACAIPEAVDDRPVLELADAELELLLDSDGRPIDDDPEWLGPIDDDDEEGEFDPGDVDEPVLELRPPSPPADLARFVAAMRAKPAPAPAAPRVLEPALSREECRRCGVPGFKGCDHWAPYRAAPVLASKGRSC